MVETRQRGVRWEFVSSFAEPPSTQVWQIGLQELCNPINLRDNAGKRFDFTPLNGNLKHVLLTFSIKYWMTPEDFYLQYLRGVLKPKPDFTRWAGLCFEAGKQGMLKELPPEV